MDGVVHDVEWPPSGTGRESSVSESASPSRRSVLSDMAESVGGEPTSTLAGTGKSVATEADSRDHSDASTSPQNHSEQLAGTRPGGYADRSTPDAAPAQALADVAHVLDLALDGENVAPRSLQDEIVRRSESGMSRARRTIEDHVPVGPERETAEWIFDLAASDNAESILPKTW